MRVPFHKQSPTADYAPIFPGRPLQVPLLTVVVKHKDKKHKLLALVDSGADACLFPKDVADVLGITLSSGRAASLMGIGRNRVPFYFHEVEILFGRYHFRTQAGFARDNIGVSGLLGQKGFFEQFLVTFDNAGNYFEVSKPNLVGRIKAKLCVGK